MENNIMSLVTLEGPYEFAEILDGQTLTLHPTDFEIGKAQTHPPWTPVGTLIWYKVIRIHVPTTEKPLFPHYWDFGQKTLVPQLLGILPAAVAEHEGITITAVGAGPKKRFSVGYEVTQPP